MFNLYLKSRLSVKPSKFPIYFAHDCSSSMTTVFHASLYGKFIEIQGNLHRKTLYRTNQGFNFLGGIVINGDNARASIQFRRESQP